MKNFGVLDKVPGNDLLYKTYFFQLTSRGINHQILHSKLRFSIVKNFSEQTISLKCLVWKSLNFDSKNCLFEHCALVFYLKNSIETISCRLTEKCNQFVHGYCALVRILLTNSVSIMIAYKNRVCCYLQS